MGVVMMSTLYLSFAVALIALALGAGLVAWGLQNRGSGVLIAKIFGIIILVLSLIVMFCIGNTAHSWSKHPMKQMGNPQMMKDIKAKMEHKSQQNGKQNSNNH